MILPTKHNANKNSKELFNEKDDVSSGTIYSDDHTSDGDDKWKKEGSAEMELKATWLGLSPPVEESSLEKLSINSGSFPRGF